MTIGVLINVLFFAGMGVAAIVRPRSVVSFVSFEPETVDARNEVRAVYGGFGIAIALILLIASDMAELRSGVLITVACALGGMAGGRLLSLFIEKPGVWPICFIFMESALAGLLLFSL